MPYILYLQQINKQLELYWAYLVHCDTEAQKRKLLSEINRLYEIGQALSKWDYKHLYRVMQTTEVIYETKSNGQTP